MPVYEQNYRPWKGHLLPYPRAWWVIARTHIRLRWKRGVIALLILASFPFLIRAIQILAMTRLSDMNFFAQLAGNLQIDAEFFRNFIQGQSFLFILMIILTGAGLIADDQKYKANQLYFSKPMTYWDYIVGKFLTVVFYGGIITVIPALLLFFMQLLLSENMAFFKAYFWVPFAIIGFGSIALCIFGGLILSLSALVSARSAGIFFFAILLFPEILRSILSSIPELGLISLGASVKQLGAVLFGLRLPYNFSAGAAGGILFILFLICLLVLRWRVRPSEVVT